MAEKELTLDDIAGEEEVEPETPEPEKVEAETETEEKVTEDKPPEESTTDSEKPWTFSQAMDERDKRQKAVLRAEAAEAKLAELQNPAQDDISILEDEPAHLAQQQQKRQMERQSDRADLSEAFAIETFGDAEVAEAKT